VVMELLEGEPLQVQLEAGPIRRGRRSSGPLKRRWASRAHSKGIVHRDLKPANLYLTRDGRVKVPGLRIGEADASRVLARSGVTPASVPATETGTSSARQATWRRSRCGARGQTNGPTSSRSGRSSTNCWRASGVPGTTFYETSYRIVNEDPEPLSTLGRAVPPGVEGIVRRCLEKRPQDRFSSAHDLSLALNAVAESLRTRQPLMEPPSKSIVVLPFENLSPDPENAFFADGLTEELIADLSKVRALRVISRTSAMLLKDSKKDVPTIARELGVRFVLEGSVRRAGSSLRITAQLIDAANDAHLWAEKYGGTLDDVFAIQEKVSGSIVDASSCS